MPRRAKSICRQAGCGALIEKPGHCEKHRKAIQTADAEQRGTAHERGYTGAWVKARAAYLIKHPLCAHCLREAGVELSDDLVAVGMACMNKGIGLPLANVVDHIIPHKLKAALDSGDQVAITKAKALFWDSLGNWQPLCKPHHDRKTAAEDGGWGRRRAAL